MRRRQGRLQITDLRWQRPVGLRQLRHAYPGYLCIGRLPVCLTSRGLGHCLQRTILTAGGAASTCTIARATTNHSVQFGQFPAVRIVVAALPDLLLMPIAAGHRGLAARSSGGALDADAAVGVSLPMDVYEHAVGVKQGGPAGAEAVADDVWLASGMARMARHMVRSPGTASDGQRQAVPLGLSKPAS